MSPGYAPTNDCSNFSSILSVEERMLSASESICEKLGQSALTTVSCGRYVQRHISFGCTSVEVS